MITFVETTSREDWTADLPPWCGGKTFQFEPHPGLTVLFGPNGSGKSTILRAVARFVFARGARQTYYRPVEMPFSSDLKDDDGKPVYGEKARHVLHQRRAPGVKVDVGWAGSRVIHLDPQQVDQVHDMDTILEQPGKLQAWCKRRTGSGGENALALLDQYFACIPESPLLKAVEEPRYNETWLAGVRFFNSFAAPEADDGIERRTTILLDEADRSASIPWQVKIWSRVRELVDTGVQVIAVSHSVAALEVADRVVETEPGCVEATMALVRRVAAKDVGVPTK